MFSLKTVPIKQPVRKIQDDPTVWLASHTAVFDNTQSGSAMANETIIHPAGKDSPNLSLSLLTAA